MMNILDFHNSKIKLLDQLLEGEVLPLPRICLQYFREPLYEVGFSRVLTTRAWFSQRVWKWAKRRKSKSKISGHFSRTKMVSVDNRKGNSAHCPLQQRPPLGSSLRNSSLGARALESARCERYRLSMTAPPAGLLATLSSCTQPMCRPAAVFLVFLLTDTGEDGGRWSSMERNSPCLRWASSSIHKNGFLLFTITVLKYFHISMRDFQYV